MFDRSHPGEPLAVRYPAEGTYQLTYPYILTTADRLTRAAAQKFGTVLRSPYGTASMRYEGFRTATGKADAWPGSYGLARSTPHLLPEPGPAQAGQALRAWRRVNLGTRVPALNDVSSAMATPIGPGGPTLEQILSRTAVRSLARFRQHPDRCVGFRQSSARIAALQADHVGRTHPIAVRPGHMQDANTACCSRSPPRRMGRPTRSLSQTRWAASSITHSGGASARPTARPAHPSPAPRPSLTGPREVSRGRSA
jgi:hypothetical protein